MIKIDDNSLNILMPFQHIHIIEKTMYVTNPIYGSYSFSGKLALPTMCFLFFFFKDGCLFWLKMQKPRARSKKEKKQNKVDNKVAR